MRNSRAWKSVKHIKESSRPSKVRKLISLLKKKTMVNKSINVYLFSDSRTAVKTQQIIESIQM